MISTQPTKNKSNNIDSHNDTSEHVVSISLNPKHFFKFISHRLSIVRKIFKKNDYLVRFSFGLAVAVIFFGLTADVFKPIQTEQSYKLPSTANTLIGQPVKRYADMLKFDVAKQQYNYNQGYQLGEDVAGTSSKPKFSAVMNADPSKGTQIIDPSSKINIGFTPKFSLQTPRQDKNRLIYPFTNSSGALVNTSNGAGIKEDILIDKYQGDRLSFKYELKLDSKTQARIESDGRIGIYGPDQLLLGNISTGSKADEKLLEKARANAQKTNLLFTLPAPYIKESNKTKSNATAQYKLNGNELSLEVNGLKGASYPLSIDPSVYVESAAKFMRGNNESNIDFDTTNELIQKGKLSGARYESWTSSTSLNAARWNGATVVAGGYIYVIGGSSGTTNFGNVYWAKLNNSTGTIDSPDPGNGACTNWCTNTAYDLPSSQLRRGLSAVAYNGYLYAIGGKDAGCAGTNTACGTVYYAKIGANGEPISWTATNSLGTDRMYAGAVAYNNRIYVAGGQTDASLNGDTGVESATVKPDGSLSTWSTTGMTVLTSARWGFSMLQYNGFLYIVGGASTTTLAATVEYNKIKSDGTMNSWVSTTSFGTARGSFGGTFATISGGYMYINGGCGSVTSTDCTSINSSGTTASQATTTITGTGTNWTSALIGNSITYANGTVAMITAVASTTSMTANVSQTVAAQAYSIDIGSANSQLASINADGTVTDWTSFNTTASTYYSAGTSACQGATTACNSNGTLLTGVGTTWTSAMVGMTLTFSTGMTTLITAFTNTTSMTGGGSQTRAATTYKIAPTFGRLFGAGLVSWRGSVYSVGGCTQPTASGNCTGTLGPRSYNHYATIKTDGDVSPKSTETTLPTMGNAAGQVGRTSSGVVVNNGYIYNIGGCANVGCTTMSPNTASAPINADGTLGAWTVDSTGTLNTTLGLGAFGTAVYNNVVYVVGGTDGNNNWTRSIWRATLDSGGAGVLSAWTEDTNRLVTAYGYAFSFTRAANATTGNIYAISGCTTNATGVGCSTYENDVLKCTITNSTAATSGCTATGQLQLQDIDAGTAGTSGLGLTAGAVWGDYIYLAGGACGSGSTAGSETISCDGVTSSGTNNRAEINKVFVAKIDATNNIVKAGITANNEWQIASNTLPEVRRREVAFAVNGYLYVAAGHDGTTGVVATLSDVIYAKIDPTTGDLGAFTQISQSGSTNNIITQRWNLGYVEANGYLYFVGGCTTGAPPSSCSAMAGTVESIQVYNNYSGSPKLYSTSSAVGTSGTGVDRIGGSATVLNGYIYYAGGCTVIACGTMSNLNYYAQINADGTLAAWTVSPNNLPASVGWGSLVNAGGTLYYIGGQIGAGTAQTAVYYSTPSSGVPGTWNTASNGLPLARTQISAAVYNDRIYVAGGETGGTTSTKVYYSPSQSAGGNISSAWTDNTSNVFTTARSGNITVAYGSTLYVIGGFDGTNYLMDVQYAPIDNAGAVGAFSYGTTLPQPIRNADGFAANGYLYVFGGRSAASTCTTATYVAPIIGYPPGNATRYGIGIWSQTNVTFTGARYGLSAAYGNGRTYLLEGGCAAMVSSGDRTYYSTLQSQPQISSYSLAIDTDTDVTPLKWLMNGIDNGIGAQWVLTYQSSTTANNAWGCTTTVSPVTLGTPGTYTPKDVGCSGTNTARYYYLYVTVDASLAFGYPEDVTRGPTIDDLTLEFTSDPSKRLIHGKTFTGGVQQPLDTPF